MNQVSSRSIFSDAPLFDLRCTISVQFGGIVTYVFLDPSEAGHYITSETDTPSLDGLYCTCGTESDDVSIFLLLSCATIGK